MSAASHRWCKSAWKQVESLPGELGRDMRARWDTHAHRGHAVVTFFGPYDSGKSSLLKRLLVDCNQEVPDWLTVSGRRETFELREVSLMSIVVRDTPGIAGGNKLHERVAREGLLLSDVIVLVLPPQLITSDKEVIAAVMNGSLFNCKPNVAFPRKGLLIVLCRMEEAGAMPQDDLPGYVSLMKRKREELGEFLRELGVQEALVSVHVASGDPFGLIGNGAPSGRADYDSNRDWDGVAAVTDFLRTLPSRTPELRLHCEVRFLGAELCAVRAALEQLEVESRTTAEAAENEARSHALVQERLNALFGAARADLDKCIEEEVMSAARRGAADVKELNDVVIERLGDALDQWDAKHSSALEVLIREADSEMKVRRNRPAWKKLSEVLSGSIPEPDVIPGGKSLRETIDKGHTLTKTLHKGFRDAQPMLIGMPLDKARNELRRFQQAESFEEYARQTPKGANAFRTIEHAKQARRAILVDIGFEVAVPAMLELGGLLGEVVVAHKAAKQRAERRKEIRRVIEGSTRKLADRAWSLWREEGSAAAMEATFAELRSGAEAAATALKAENESVSLRLASIRRCLDELQ